MMDERVRLNQQNEHDGLHQRNYNPWDQFTQLPLHHLLGHFEVPPQMLMEALTNKKLMRSLVGGEKRPGKKRDITFLADNVLQE